MTRDVLLDHVTIRFGSFTAVDNAYLNISGGEFFSFLGPSGCGKTTLLRCISGFVEPTEGRVMIAGQDMARVGPNKRPTALIFQNLALFPLMSVAENIAFPLEVRGVSRKGRRKRADALLDLIALPGVGDKKVYELSGGQRQRVAIARALAVEPDILLLDEPLSALDLKLRQHMRTELRAIQQRVGLTFIYITHDQGEALTMSDRVAVMNRGVIEQVDAPTAIYETPRTAFVAAFVGETNVIPGTVLAQSGVQVRLGTPLGPLVGTAAGGRRYQAGEAVQLFVRPEQLVMDAEGPIAATVEKEEFEGATRHVFARAGLQALRLSRVNAGAAGALGPGAPLRLGYDAARASVLPASDGGGAIDAGLTA
ncbi:ABC transporter ATP-binding protein [Mangrovibrevibacter kandeliae]|uniref:ABC transporter ATP-binding protein n=1 Tax=Mangrovibrevibacter kandeliae TaxID=2968473 RepID=UPI0021187FB1|nr:ABC transporter ATP-binding protein [Aurantimonas sp. CSK15Z-1]MCQ8784168.1 ABC transporter ATP-binding protein [Aurantimonas sp. CSK15Z-1]MCQ8784271.1 ABC transporter ATP-binding protein [Aurantimonas sp. CSK15Z-1]